MPDLASRVAAHHRFVWVVGMRAVTPDNGTGTVIAVMLGGIRIALADATGTFEALASDCVPDLGHVGTAALACQSLGVWVTLPGALADALGSVA